jgi:hypothetical protein
MDTRRGIIMANDRTHCFSPRHSPLDLPEIRQVASEVTGEATPYHGRPGTVFQNVSQSVILASVLATTSLAFYHLWKEICRDNIRAQSSESHSSAATTHRRR